MLLSAKIFPQQEKLRNDRYEIIYDVSSKYFTVEELVSSKKEKFTPTFVVLFKQDNAITPKITEIKEATEGIGYYTTGWSGEVNLFDAAVGNIRKRSVSGYTRTSPNQLQFTYENSGEFTIESILTLPEGNEEPCIEGRIVPQQRGYFSLGYYGASAYDHASLDELWQPLVWTDKIFPKNKYLTPAHLCTLPATMLRKNGVTSGVIADPSELSFSPLPTLPRSRFGVAIHNNQDLAQSMIFAPIMGSSFSLKLYNETYSFKYRLFVSSKNISESYAYLAQNMYGFGSRSRDNALCSLNETFENMMDYCLNPFSQYNSELKGYSYETDVAASVRNTSALHALNLAFVTDNRTFYSERAIPVIEYMLSRDKDLFSLDPSSGAGGQTATNSLGNPSIRTSELAMLYQMGNQTNPFLLNMAMEKLQASSVSGNLAHERTWKENMAMYNSVAESSYLSKAKQGADSYITTRINGAESDFNYTNHSKSSFWSALAPKWIELFEMYEATNDTKYLDAAYEGALRFTRFLWMSPAVPDSKIIVNVGNKAPVYGDQSKTPITIPQESVDAWRLSEMGLHTEAAGTAASHRAVFMAHHAPYMLRIAALKNDTYLYEIAKNAVIGRYRNFPGYHINTDRTTVYEKLDFPLRNHSDITSTSMHYSHIVPMTSLILDYMVSDVTARSNGQINFNSQFVEAFAYLQGRTYCGYGNFYDTDSVVLYMPKQLLIGGEQQLNYIAARKDDNLYLVFSNQSDNVVETSYTINPDLVKTTGANVGKVYTNNILSGSAILAGNDLSTQVPANGIVAVEVSNAQTIASLQNPMLSNKNVWQKDFVKMTDITGAGMILNFGEGNNNAFIYSSAAKDTYQKITIEYRINDSEPKFLEDASYPFEFSIPLPVGTNSISYKLTATGAEGTAESIEYKLEKKASLSLIMEGNQVVRNGEEATVICYLSGEKPWNIAYKQNGNIKTIENVSQTPLKIKVNVSENTLIEPVSVSNLTEQGSVSGRVEILLATASVDPDFDSHVAESAPATNYSGATQMELKNGKSWSREIYLNFNISALNKDDEKIIFRAYMNSMQPSQDIVISIEGNNNTYNSQLCWNNKEFYVFEPISDRPVTAISVSEYIQWDITQWIRQQLEQNESNAAFRLRIPNPADALCKFYSTEWNNGKFSPAILSVKSVTVGVDTQIGTTPVIEIYPNPAENYFKIKAEKPLSRVEVWNLSGSLVYQYVNASVDKEIDISVLPQGVYFVKIFTSDSEQSIFKLIKSSR